MESMGGSFVEYYSDRRMHVFLLQTFFGQFKNLFRIDFFFFLRFFLFLLLFAIAERESQIFLPVTGLLFFQFILFLCDLTLDLKLLFGKSHIDEIAAQHDIKAVAKLPINPEAASKVDGGFAEDLDVSALDNIFEAIRNC